jgi:Na+-driven multidrug efflux pump
MSDAPNNTFLTGSLGAIYVKTALPIIFVMGMNGLLNVVDALFLGHYVGPEALAAVTLMFPAWMLIVATATLVGGGMSSILARHVGGGRIDQAQAVFAGAHGLALMLSGCLILLFLAFGHPVAMFSIVLGFRLKGRTALRPSALLRHSMTGYWGRILALGAPQSLNFVGISFATAVVMAALQWVDSSGYDSTVSAYGIITRVLTFGFMPLLGLSFAMQTITGNNFGAAACDRSDRSLQIGIGAAFVYSVVIQLVMTVFPRELGAAFVDDAVVIDEVTRILPIVVATFFIAGPLMMIGSYFQAIGDAGRAALLGLTKNYVFAIPLTFGLASWIGEPGIWLAGPVSDPMLLALAAILLRETAIITSHRWGLFRNI